MARSRNPEQTRRAILDAARTEFAARGLAGGRTDTIAAAAAVNKRMLYHYFVSKERLYAAVLADRLGRYAAIDPAESLRGQLDQRAVAVDRDREDLRLLMWEALTGAAPNVLTDSTGASVWRERVDGHRAAQRDGRLAADLDPAQLELALTALTVFPVAFREMTRAITGSVPGEAAFDSAHRAFLNALTGRFETAVAAAQQAMPSTVADDVATAARPSARPLLGSGSRKLRVRLAAATVNRVD